MAQKQADFIGWFGPTLDAVRRLGGSAKPREVSDLVADTTAGTFTTAARREADRDRAPPVELVDGAKLVEMFEQVELGLTPKTTREVERSFFEPFLPEAS